MRLTSTTTTSSSRVPLWALTAASALLLAGCPGGGDTDDRTDTDDRSAPPVKVCDLATDEALADVNPDDREPVEVLMRGRSNYVACSVGSPFAPAVQFGVRVVDDEESITDAVTLATQESEPLEGIGDEAILARDGDTSITAGADFAGTHVIVSNISAGDEPDQISEDATVALLRSIGEQLPRDVAERIPAVELGDGCVDVDADELVSVIGEVELARGGTDGERTECAYLGPELATANVDLQGGLDGLPPLTTDSVYAATEVDGVDAATVTTGSGSVSLFVQPEEGASQGQVRVFVPAADELDEEPVRQLTTAMVAAAGF